MEKKRVVRKEIKINFSMVTNYNRFGILKNTTIEKKKV